MLIRDFHLLDDFCGDRAIVELFHSLNSFFRGVGQLYRAIMSQNQAELEVGKGRRGPERDGISVFVAERIKVCDRYVGEFTEVLSLEAVMSVRILRVANQSLTVIKLIFFSGYNG